MKLLPYPEENISPCAYTPGKNGVEYYVCICDLGDNIEPSTGLPKLYAGRFTVDSAENAFLACAASAYHAKHGLYSAGTPFEATAYMPIVCVVARLPIDDQTLSRVDALIEDAVERSENCKHAVVVRFCSGEILAQDLVDSYGRDAIADEDFLLSVRGTLVNRTVRQNTIIVENIVTVTADQLRVWLENGYSVKYQSKTIYPADHGDDVVWGTDGYGQGYIAGSTSDYEDVLSSFSRQSPGEHTQRAESTKREAIDTVGAVGPAY